MKKLKLKQMVVVAGTIYGLDKNGQIWRLDNVGWIKIRMDIATGLTLQTLDFKNNET